MAQQQMVLLVSVDVVFLLNFVVDLAWLLATAALSGVRLRGRRLLLGAAAGAEAVVWAYFPSGRWLTSSGGVLVGTVLVLGLTFRPRTIREALRILASFIGVGVAMAGAAILAHSQGTPGGLPGTVLPVSFKPLLVAVGVALCAGGGRQLWRAVVDRARLTRGVYGLRVRFGLQTVELTALLDTGNSLRDPLSGTPVVVAEATALAPALPEPVTGAVRAGWEALERLPEGLMARCRLVPFRAVGQPAGALLAIAPDEMAVRPPGGPEWLRVEGLVGLAGEPLHPDGAYRALLSPALLEAAEGVPGMSWEGETG